MPNFDPLDAISEIRESFPTMKILVVSAFDDDHLVQGLLKQGVDGYHLKDQPLSDLSLAINRIMDGKRWISAPLITKLVENPEIPPEAHNLTYRQSQILRMLNEGHGNQEIATEMNLSVKTIENHLTRLYRLLGVKSRLEASTYVNQHPEVLGIKGHGTTRSKDHPPKRLSDLSVLLVDDNRQYLHQLQRVLGNIIPQIDLYKANETKEAINIAQKIKPKLALVDVVLGDEDGIRCAKRIKAVSNNTRVIMISAYPDREFHRLSIEAGAIAFLDKKDLDRRTLHQVIKDLV
jgi:DNA-binding NarL/FixJ family response regulator